MSRFSRFSLVGLSGAVLQLILLWIFMKWFHLSALAATPPAVELVVLNNFGWHQHFTWCDRPVTATRDRALRLWRFHAGNGLVSLAGNTALTYVFVNLARLPAVPAAASAIALCSWVNFFVADHWVYRQTCLARRQKLFACVCRK